MEATFLHHVRRKGCDCMEFTTIEWKIPKEMTKYIVNANTADNLKINAMILYPYILNKTISHGRAAEILGISKLDLIDLYGEMGFSYFDMTMDEIEDDVRTLQELREKE